MISAPVLDQLAVLSDATRVRMLAVLERQELTVSELCEVLQLPQSTVSRHLKTLSDGAWLAARREATSRLYAVSLEDLPASARGLWLVVREQVLATAAAEEDDRRLQQVLVERRSKSTAFFSSSAGQWDRLRDDQFGPSTPLRALLGLLDPRWTVADLGCGTGQVSALVAPFVSRVIGVDASPQMLEAARTRLQLLPHVDIRDGALEAVPIADETVDAAFLVLVLHHAPDPARVLAEAVRILRPGGRLVIVDMLPHDREDYRQTMGHVWLGFSDRQMARLLAGAGLEHIRLVPLPPEPRVKGPSLFVASGMAAGAFPAVDPAHRQPAGATL